MPSILPGFEYDIFISYRQKDNKYDGWVTEFVANLKKELEATFKEDVSIYFDINPHDGLLETHDVDKSLESKLRCLIFIPIISQTYCDPKSFAWQHEFCAFNKRSNEDQFGKDIKLANGNVASRILPVKIHELDEEDTAVVEAELGGVLRPIEFIFKSAGVNRPLRAVEERPQDNLHKTNYRDQINKVANAVKEIIGGLKRPQGREMKSAGKARAKSNLLSKQWRSGPKWMAVAAGAMLLFLVGVYFFILPNFSLLKAPETSGIAVLPFRNTTGDESLNYYGVGMASEIRTKLSLSKQFSFISSLQAALRYSNTDKSLKEIAAELNVDYLLSGLYQKAGNKIKVEVELIDASTGRAVWTLPVEDELADIFQVQASIAEKVLNQFLRDHTKQKLIEVPAANLEAYAHCTLGYQLYHMGEGDEATVSVALQPAVSHFEKAIALDSGYADAWAGLIDIESYILLNESADSVLKAKIEKYVDYYNNHFPDSWQKKLIQGQFAYRVRHDYDRALALLLDVTTNEPDNETAFATISAIYKRKLLYGKSIQFRQRSLELDPSSASGWKDLGDVLSAMGDSKNASKAYLKSWDLFHSIDAARNYLYQSVHSNSIDRVPDDMRKKLGYEFDYARQTVLRNWSEAERIAKVDTNFVRLAEASYMLGKYDSASFWAKSGLKVITDADPRLLALSGDRRRTLLRLNEMYSKLIDTGDDKMSQCWKSMHTVWMYALMRDYPSATKELIQLNNQFPDFGGYPHFNDPVFDKIKKEYPPFQDALNNLKLKPVLDISKTIRL